MESTRNVVLCAQIGKSKEEPMDCGEFWYQ